MPGFVIDGKVEQPSSLRVLSWLDDPSLRLKIGEDGKARDSSTWIRGIVLHTTKGIPGGSDKRPQKILAGFGPSGKAGAVARYWSRSDKQAGAHLVVDHDGLIVCCADLEKEVAYHAGPANSWSVGIEIYQGADAEMYEGQLSQVVRLCDFLTRRFWIQRQFHWPYRGKPVQRVAEEDSFTGVCGHREVTNNRGLGDPGDAVFDFLRRAGYEGFDFDLNADLPVWTARQKNLCLPSAKCDGIPGPTTYKALIAAGYPSGMYVPRPGD